MSNNSLSVDDVDSLISGNDSLTSGDFSTESSEKDFQTCDLASQQRVVREKFPTLDAINERFCSALQDCLLAMLRTPSEVMVSPVYFQSFRELQVAIQAPTQVSKLTIAPLIGFGLVVCEAPLIFALVDTLFGGQSHAYPTTKRDFSATEMAVIQRLTSVVVEQYEHAWASIYPLTLHVQDSVSGINNAAVSSASEVIVCSTFSLEIGKLKGCFHICFPYAALEPIRDVLTTTAFPKNDRNDTDWLEKMSQQIELAEVELIANFAEMKSTVRDLLAMEKGQILQCSVEKNVIARVSDVPLLNCRFGSKNGRIALKVNRFMNDPELF